MEVDPRIYSYVVSEETFLDQAIIIEEGSRNDWVYLVLEGTVLIKKRTAKGLITLGKLGEGSIFGEMAFLEGGNRTRSASVVAASGLVRTGMLDTLKLRKEYNTLSPELKALIQAFIWRVKEVTEKVCAMVVAIE